MTYRSTGAVLNVVAMRTIVTYFKFILDTVSNLPLFFVLLSNSFVLVLKCVLVFFIHLYCYLSIEMF